MKKGKLVVKSEKIPKSKKYKILRNTLGTMLALCVGASSHLYFYNKVDKIDNYDIKGYSNLNLRRMPALNDDSFVILDAGDNDTTKTNLFESKLSFLNKKSIPTGIIINSNSYKLCDIYSDALYTKYLIEKFDIDYPVFFNIDNVFDNESLRMSEKVELISAFLEKTSLNGIYVSLYGKEENLSRIANKVSDGSKYSNIFKDYDCLVISDDNDIEFKGTYSIIMDKDGKLHANKELDSIINKHNLNNKSRFVSDEKREFMSGENILDVAESYNLSVHDIKKYNNIDGDIKEGTILRIPNRVRKNSNELLDPKIYNEVKYKGIDISSYQENIDWNKMSDNVDFIIVRLTDFCKKDNDGRNVLDKNFKSNVYKCQELGIKYGVYGLTRAMDKESIINEANYIIENLKNMNVDYPVYLDLEAEHYNKWKNCKKTDEEITEMINSWCSVIAGAGYTPGIYTSQKSYVELVEKTDGEINDYELWVANNYKYNQDLNYQDCVSFANVLKRNPNVAIKQLSSHGHIDGIDGYVDINCCYKNYSKQVINEKEEIPSFDKNIIKSKNNDFTMNVVTGVGLLGTIGTYAIVDNIKKKKYR